jgi:hypothetical protein
MYQSHYHASRGNKTAFVEMAQREAEAARLPDGTGLAQRGWLSRQARSLARRADSLLDRLTAGVGEWMAEHRVPVA